MHIKRLSLIVGLLTLPTTYADAADITINVPVKLTNVPAKFVVINVLCYVGVGPASPQIGVGWTGDKQIGQGEHLISVNTGATTINQTASVRIKLKPGIPALNPATHYKCWLADEHGRNSFVGDNEVSGPIPWRSAPPSTMPH